MGKKLIDVNVQPLEDQDINWADMIFISAMIVQKEDAISIIARCKQAHKVVVAGVIFTTNHDDFEYLGVDHFVLDEGEITLPLFLKDLANGNAKKAYLHFCRKTRYYQNARATLVLSQCPGLLWNGFTIFTRLSIQL